MRLKKDWTSIGIIVIQLILIGMAAVNAEVVTRLLFYLVSSSVIIANIHIMILKSK